MVLEPGAAGGGVAYEMVPRVFLKGPRGQQNVEGGDASSPGTGEPAAEPAPQSRAAFASHPWVGPSARM